MRSDLLDKPPVATASDAASRPRVRRFASLLGEVSVALAIALLVGRLLSAVVPPLAGTVLAQIRALGALGFLCFGVAVAELARSPSPRRLRVAAPTLALAILGAFGVAAALPPLRQFALVEWLVRNRLAAAPVTAASDVLAAAALLELLLRRRPRLFQMAAFVMLFVGVVSMLGLTLSAREITEVLVFREIHVIGAIGDVIMGVGLVCLRPEVGFLALVTRKDPTGALARRIAVGLLTIPLATVLIDRLGTHQSGLWGDHFGQALNATLQMTLFAVILWVGVEALDRTSHARSQAESELAQARIAYRNIVDTMGEGVWVFDQDMRITFANRRLGEMLGFELPELEGRRLEEFVLAEDLDATRMRIERRKAGIRESFDQRLVRKDGSLLWAIINANPMLDEQGRFTGSLGTLTDITARRAAEDARRESEDRFRQIAEHVSEVFFVSQIDPPRLLYANTAFERIWGVSLATLAHNPNAWIESIHADDVANVKAALAACHAQPDVPFDVRYRVVRRDGSIRWVHDRGRSLRGPDGRPHRVVGIATDVTDLALAEERRSLLMSELDHRVKNTLATVVALLDVTIENETDPTALRDALTSRIYAMARTHDGLARLRWEAVPVARLAELALAPWLGLPTERITLEGDPARLPARLATPLSLALNELATNSLKYGALTCPSGHVRVTWQSADGGDLCISWVERGGPTPRPPARLGTGLTLMRDLVEYQLHGTLTVAFADEGVEVSIRFPLPRASSDVEASSVRRTPLPTTPSTDVRSRTLAGVRVLVLEDDPLQARMLSRQLARMGCEVAELASTVQAALRCIEQDSLDGAVLDINVGGSSSLPVANALLDRRVPFVFVSGYALSEALPAALARVPRLTKPVEPAELEALAKRHFARGAPQAEPS
ncbi:MAG: PAS domain S-box protein [bacterium]